MLLALLLISVCQICLGHNLTQQSCKEGWVQCEHGINWRDKFDDQCIRSEHLCDGVIDCSDSSDEKYCSVGYNFGYTGFVYKLIQGPCGDDQVMCRTEWRADHRGKCIDKNQICDDKPDCLDNSDEEHCPYVHEFGFHFELSQKDCPSGYYRCANERNSNKRCIKQSWICDGNFDCPDDSDERYCPYIFNNKTVLNKTSNQDTRIQQKSLNQTTGTSNQAKYTPDKANEIPNPAEETPNERKENEQIQNDQNITVHELLHLLNDLNSSNTIDMTIMRQNSQATKYSMNNEIAKLYNSIEAVRKNVSENEKSKSEMMMYIIVSQVILWVVVVVFIINMKCDCFCVRRNKKHYQGAWIF